MKKVLKGATIIDGLGGQPINDGVVVINGHKIESVGTAEQVSHNGGDEVIDLKGRHVIPGLIDAHIHLDMHGMADTYNENLVEIKLRTLRSAREMEDTLKAGFTTVRNMGSHDGIDFAVKTGIETGYTKGPRIITSGRIITMTCSGTDYFKGLYRIADGVDDCRKAAREQLRDGADCLKLMATGAVMNPGGVPGAPQFNIDEMAAIAEEGAKLGIHTAAHGHGAEGIKNAIRAGCRTIEHATMADDEAIGLMADKGVFMVTTMSLHQLFMDHAEVVPRFMVEKSQAMEDEYINVVSKAIKAGVTIAMGTDAGTNFNYHGKNAAEIVYYVKAGLMSPLVALASATKNAAEAIQMDNLVGTLQPGKLADLVVLTQDPLADIECLTDQENIEMVFKGGELQF